jgi:hypothetical protein
MTDKAKPTTAQKAKIDAEARLKTIEAAIKKLIGQYEELNQAYTQHICTPDAHNPGMMGKKK